MKKNNKARIVVLSTLAGLTLFFLGAAVISFQNATKAHQNSPYMKMTPTDETQQPTESSPPTLTAWEQVQQQVEQLRQRLERGSDGYQGLSTALEESEPNENWCNNLLIAIQDFKYINDTTGSQAVQELANTQNCE